MIKQHLAMAVAAIALVGPTAYGQTIESSETTLPTLSTENASYGTRMSINGDWLAIGADHEVVPNSGEGEVYLYKKNNVGWVLQQLIKAPDGFVNNHFGLPVVVGQRRMMIGAPLDTEAGPNSGAVYVYRLNQSEWVFEQKIVSPTANHGALFGLSCCFGTTEEEIIVGAFFESLTNYTSGGAYVYRRTGTDWSFIQKLSAPGAPVAAYFGRSVAVSGQNLIIGASGYRTASDQSAQGAAMLYQRDEEEWVWTLKDLILSPSPQYYQAFGEWIDITDTTVAICSPGFTGEVGVGLVNTFSIEPEGTLQHLQRIDPPNVGCKSFGFPCIFSPSGNRLMLGAYRSTFEIHQEGAAYIYQAGESGWDRPVSLIPPITGENNFFGLSGAFTESESEIFVSSPRCDLEEINAGVVFRFELRDCTENGQLDAWDIASGLESDTNEDGIPDSCQGKDCPGDFNGDGLVNGSDMGLLLSVFGSTDPPEGTDLNNDGLINGADLGLLFSAWGSCS